MEKKFTNRAGGFWGQWEPSEVAQSITETESKHKVSGAVCSVMAPTEAGGKGVEPLYPLTVPTQAIPVKALLCAMAQSGA